MPYFVSNHAENKECGVSVKKNSGTNYLNTFLKHHFQFFVVLFYLSESLTLYHSLALNLLCIQSQPQTSSIHLTLTSQMLELL